MDARDAGLEEIANRSDIQGGAVFHHPSQDRSDLTENVGGFRSDGMGSHTMRLPSVPSSPRCVSSFPSWARASSPSSVRQLHPAFRGPPSCFPSFAVTLLRASSPVSLSVSFVPGDAACKARAREASHGLPLSDGLDPPNALGAKRRPGEHEESFQVSDTSGKAPPKSGKPQEELAETATASTGSGEKVWRASTHEGSDGICDKVGVPPPSTSEEMRNKTRRTDREERGASGTVENATLVAHARCHKRRRDEQEEQQDASGTRQEVRAADPAWANKVRAREGQGDERKDAGDAGHDDDSESVVSSCSDENTERQKASLSAIDSASSLSGPSLLSCGVPGSSLCLILNERAQKQEKGPRQRGKAEAGEDADAVKERTEKPEPKDGSKGGKETEGREDDEEAEETLFEFDEDDLWFLLYERHRHESDRSNTVAMDSTESHNLPAETQLSEELKAAVTDSLAKQILYSDKYQDSAYEYRAVTLPLQHPFLSRALSPLADAIRRERRRMSEKLWRSLGVRMSCGWRHWGWSMYEPNVLFFARPKWTDGITGIPPKSAAFAAKRHDRMRDLLAQEVAKGMNIVSRAVRLSRMATQDCHLMTDTEDDGSSSPICSLYQACLQ
ncbi:hypothetical protein NCLIV_060780 [Neospora caninum Liverpool]|uniref:Cyclin-dependent kinases regulatory subunit n=1 Tax=Neospora caninum (strain Liverpool) TaxID=572307 RepID=F0VPK7_NEOCL|nr:hypothetical protein NCLIV_060780 [Neospora caninum Liverpool]CBZ55654.1 hypothetical protein NCLIV_060780 [Neospora caninum Liverpool]CEL70395.1 TPA: cyclin-dependent kinase regulatory subunit protein [Neospora caninum Liverpool]|eukprot:XP_003885680.1 hypothetical protein NCLIV_060780 [Neospora caninum Liverpool]